MFILSGLITRNITKSSLKLFVKGLGIDDYKESSNLNEYISYLINNKRLSESKLNNYLFNELFYGQQKDVYIEKIFKYNSDISSKTKLDKIISTKYNGNSSFNRIATTVLSNEEEKLELVACDTTCNRENGEVNNIKMIFAYKIQKYNNDKVLINEHSYVPIEVNLEEGIMVSKVAPKTNIIKDAHKPEYLYDKYSNIVKKIFGIDSEPYNDKHKKVLYSMSDGLYRQVYEKITSNRSGDLEDIIKKFSEQVHKELKISNLKKKIKKNNIYDIEESINKYFDKLMITDLLSNREIKSKDINDIEGVVTYLRFSDGTNVSAKVKGENYKASIYTSETYLALRDPIKNANKVSELNVVWILKNKDLRVKYNTNSFGYLFLHFYRDYRKEDFDYGYKKYKKYEQLAFSRVKRMAR